MGKYFAIALSLFWVSSSFAMDGCGAGPCAKCHSLSLKEANELLRGVGEVKKVQSSPVNGLWLLELEKDGRQGVAFMDFGKKNLMVGTIFPLPPGTTAGEASSQPPAPSSAVVDAASIPLENSILLGNRGGKKRMFVFTDPDCPFCAKLHTELKELSALEPDLAIYVKMFPLKMHPDSYDKARVILGRNSLDLLEKAFAGASLPQPGAKDSEKPVEETLKLAQSLGIDATPTLVLPGGRIISGFRDAKALQKLLVGKN